MPGVIPSKIHLVYATRTFTEADARFAMHIARKVPGSTVMLWSRGAMQGTVVKVFEALRDSYTTEKIQISDLFGVYLGMSFTSSLGHWGCVRFSSIDDLEPITNKYPFEKYDVHRLAGEPLIEDVVGLWAVYGVGGMYLSKEGVTDVSCKQGFFGNVNADILLGELGTGELPFTCSLIAAPPKSEKIKSLCGLLAVHKIFGSPLVVEAPQLGLGPSGGASGDVLFEGGTDGDENPSYDYADMVIQPVSAKRLPFDSERYSKLEHTVWDKNKSRYALVKANPSIFEHIDFHTKTASEIVRDWVLELDFEKSAQPMGVAQARYINFEELRARYSIQRHMNITVEYVAEDMRNTVSCSLVELRKHAKRYIEH